MWRCCRAAASAHTSLCGAVLFHQRVCLTANASGGSIAAAAAAMPSSSHPPSHPGDGCHQAAPTSSSGSSADAADANATAHVAEAERAPMVELRSSALERLKHRIVRALTTSARSRAQMRDTANARKYAQLERTKVQWINDVFMSEGKAGRDSVDERTLEKGLTWSFLLPVCAMMWAFLVVFLWFARANRDEQLRAQAASFEARLTSNKERIEAEALAHAAFLKTIDPTTADHKG